MTAIVPAGMLSMAAYYARPVASAKGGLAFHSRFCDGNSFLCRSVGVRMTVSPGETALARARKGRLHPAKLGPLGMFFLGFLKHPVMVGSIIPSSKRTIDRMLSRVDWKNTK